MQEPSATRTMTAGEQIAAAGLFAVFGLLVELVFTGVFSGFSGSFLGHVSLLMVPVYATAYFAMGPLLGLLARLDWDTLPIRLPLAVLVIYTFEWSFGAAYRAMGLQPWYYDHGWASDFSDGNITLYYLPAWLVFAWIVVPARRAVRDLAPHVVGLFGSS